MDPLLQPKFKKIVLEKNQTSGDIAKALKYAIQESKPAANIIIKKFASKDPVMTCFNIWKFCKTNIIYIRETAEVQTARSLQRILYDKHGDCKHYTIIACSLLNANGIKTKMRLISQSFYNSDPTHIYCIATIGGKEIVIDPCMNTFNNEAAYKYKNDIKI